MSFPVGIVASASNPAAVSPYYTAKMARTPSMYLRLGESSGTTAADATGNGRTGTYTPAGVTLGTAGLLPGDPNTAVTMSGAGQRLAVPYNGAWMTGDRTVECIIKPSNITDAAGHTVMSQADATAGTTWHIEIYLSNLYLYCGGLYATGSVPITNNTRYHLAYRLAGNVHTLSLNGTQVLSRQVTIASTGALRVGSRHSTPVAPFSGIVDEVSWIPSALSNAQILADAQLAGF